MDGWMGGWMGGISLSVDGKVKESHKPQPKYAIITYTNHTDLIFCSDVQFIISFFDRIFSFYLIR
jgi:hypothetical protein